MSNLLKALNELGEVKLSSDVIELASVGELDLLNKKVEDGVGEIADLRNKLDKAKSNMFSQIQKVEGDIKQAQKASSDFSKAAKSLGVDAKSVPSYKKLQDTIKFMNAQVDKVRKDL